MTSPDLFKDRFNETATEMLTRRAEEVRGDFIGMAAWILKDRLRLQFDSKQTFQPGDQILFWVKRAAQPVITDGESQPTMSFVVEGPPTNGEFPRLKVHVPVPEGFRSDEETHLAPLIVPDIVFPERLVKRGDEVRAVSRYAITKAECRTYPVADANPDIGPELWVAQKELRVETHLPEVAQMAEDLINWNLIPQSASIVGEGPVVDF